MVTLSCLEELRDGWFPHTTDSGLNRVIELLERGSPLLVHGTFTKTCPMGCLATHIAWHHPTTEQLYGDAGIIWLSRIAGLNPATSQIIRIWDQGGIHDWDTRAALIEEFKLERERRKLSRMETDQHIEEYELVGV